MIRGDQRAGIACAGNWILDRIHLLDRWPGESELCHIGRSEAAVGGGAANVAFDLAAFGVKYPVLPLGLIGGDDAGDRIVAECLSRGLSTELLRPGIWPDGTRPETAQTHVMTVPGQSRTFFYHGGTNDLFDETHVDVEALDRRGIRVFYLGYLNLLPRLSGLRAEGISGAALLLSQLVSRGIMTCVDLVSTDSPRYRQEVEAALPMIDVLVLNEIEAARASGIAIPGDDPRPAMAAAADALLTRGVRRAVILHMPTLVLWKSRELELWTIPDPVPREEIVSPVGAGDAFAAGCLHGLHEGWDPSDTLALALRAAAACLRGLGASDGIPPLDGLLQAPATRPLAQGAL